MTLPQILKYINYICVKDFSGSNLKPDEVSNIFQASNINMFNKQVVEAELLAKQGKGPFNEVLFSMVALREFHVSENITFSSGAFDLATLAHSYAYWGSLITVYNGAVRKIELSTDFAITERRTNALARQLKDHPGAILLGNSLKVYPSDITTAEFVFMKNPAAPVYDYYIDANMNTVYMNPGTTHLLAANESGSAGQGSGATVTSASVELEWNINFHVQFCNEVLQKVGIELKDEQIRAYVREVEGKQP